MELCLIHLEPTHSRCPGCGSGLCRECAGDHHCPAVAPSRRERRLATAMHLASLLNFVVPVASAVGTIVLLWWVGGSTPFLNRHFHEALGFQLLYGVGLLGVVTALGGAIACLPLAPLLALFAVACSIRAAQAAGAGIPYRYPLTSWLLRI